MNVLPEVIVFAVNKDNAAQDKGYLEAYKLDHVKHVIGSWEGTTENAYIAPIADLEKIQGAARSTNQNAILYLDGNRQAYILEGPEYLMDNAIHIGRFMKVSEHVARQQTGWTFDPSTGEFFAVL